MLLYMWASCCKQWNVIFFTFSLSSKVLIKEDFSCLCLMFGFIFIFLTYKASNMHRILWSSLLGVKRLSCFACFIYMCIYISKIRHEVTNKSRTAETFNKLSRSKDLWTPCSTVKHVLWSLNTQVLLGNSLHKNNEYNTSTHYTHF